MKDRETILFFCHHSIGIGHLVRSVVLLDTLKTEFRVIFVSSGKFPEGMAVPPEIVFIQLPPLERGRDGSLQLVDKGKEIQEVIATRRNTLLEALDQYQIDFFITELFPFGRAQLGGELIPALRKIRNSGRPVKILSSLRDIVEPGLSRNVVERGLALSLAAQFFDGVLVHSDPQLIQLGDSFPAAPQMDVEIYYTGFITRAQQKKWCPEEPVVLVSAGGGKVGFPLFEMAIEAFIGYGFGPGTRLRIVTGPHLPEEEWELLQSRSQARPDIELLRSVEDLSQEFCRVIASVSQGGYNTTMEMLSCGVPALVLPFGDSGNSEQGFRTLILQEKGLLRMAELSELDAGGLAEEIRNTIDFRPAAHQLNLNGSQNTLRILSELTTKSNHPN